MSRAFVVLLSVTLLAAPGVADDAPSYKDPEITPAARQHWAFAKPVHRAAPAVKNGAWVRNPIDAFILDKLEAKGLPPSPEADRRTLIRRLSFDLIGLPPTPAEVDAFLNDKSPDAYEKLVNRILASPHYGERWAQHWLDVVRFAESNGYELDAERPQAWRYRDYVVRSLNADKPYDRFITEQVAGDLLAAGKDPRDVPDLWHATGLHRCGQLHAVSGNVDKEENRQEVLTEMVNGVGSAVLGLTVGCARCHDHKFDPISLGDYYRLQAFFAATKFRDVDLATQAEKDALSKELIVTSARLSPLKGQIADLDKPVRDRLTAEKKRMLDAKTREALATEPGKRTDAQKKLVADAGPLVKVAWDEVLAAHTSADRAKRAALQDELRTIERDLPKLPPQAWAVADEKSATTHVLKRGDVRRKTIVVSPAYPRVIADRGEPKTRLDLAKFLTAPDNPLTARVIVNRLWQHHFGRGIVNTPNDFGTRGDRPTHPELLDWLAGQLIANDWSLKRMHRLMVTSATYRQISSAERGSRGAELDPSNLLLWRMNRQRLDAEALRDAVLTAAGTLTREVGGPSVKVPLEPEVYDLIFTEDEPAGLWPVTPDPKQHTRRSLYLFVKRNVRLPMLEAFDQPDTLNSCAFRPVSTFAPQALILMNGPFTREQSRAMAVELVRTIGNDTRAQIESLYMQSLGRPVRDEERAEALTFLRQQTAELRDRVLARQAIGLPANLPPGTDPAAVRALADLCLAVFNTNEFVYMP